MACLHIMYNNQNSSDHKLPMGAPMSPRISFSNDFVESGAAAAAAYQQLMKNERSYYRDAPVSSDFEFCVSNYSTTMSADELFSKGRMLPYKEACGGGGGAASSHHHKTTTLKDELLVEDNDDFALKPPRSSSARWKGLLGLRKSHIGSKKVDKNNEEKREEVLATKNSSWDALHGGGSSSSSLRDTEFRFN